MIGIGAELMLNQVAGVADPLALSVSRLQHSLPAAKLVQQRQRIILMTAATKSFKIVGTPKVATRPAPATGTGTTATGGGVPTVAAAPPNPGTAQAIAYNMLPAFGFSHSQYGCLDNIYSRESGWRYNAWNASGAYGIPQALPGSKMASAGSDWMTNPATQISWGLGYIKSSYGSPCNAWAFWQGHGWY